MELVAESPHIVSMIETFTIEKSVYLVTKYAQGGDLLHYCINEEDPEAWMSEERAHHIFVQVAQGVRDMHHVGLVHRDLKLLNIFMCDTTDKPRVKVGDLGLSAYLDPNDVFIKRAGTTAFMAPEVMLDQPSDAKADVWSLGILLYTLICSKLPFPSKLYQE